MNNYYFNYSCFQVPETPIPISSSFGSRHQCHSQLKPKVMSSYTAEHHNEITIKKGENFNVITMNTKHDGWWLFRCHIHEGIAPSRMLSIIPSVLPSLTSDINGIIFIQYC